MDPHDRYDSLFQFYGAQRGVDWRLLKAQVRAESGFNPNARSTAGAAGLAQFLARTWEEWRDGTPGIQAAPPSDLVHLDPRDPEDAIRAQAAYMGWLLEQCQGDVRMALAAYNWGLGRMRAAAALRGRWSLESAPRETRKYVAKILAFLEADRPGVLPGPGPAAGAGAPLSPPSGAPPARNSSDASDASDSSDRSDRQGAQ
jgi:hypothetical protein